MTQWLVSLVRELPCPQSFLELASGPSIDRRAVRARVLRDCAERSGLYSEVDEGADFEDYVEQAYRLLAAVEGLGTERVWLHTTRFQATNLGTGERKDVIDLKHLPRYGPQASRPHGHVHDLASRYHEFSTFKRHAGRRVVTCGGGGSSLDLYDAMRDEAKAGTGEVFVKATEPKYGCWTVDVGLAGPERAALDTGLEWAHVYHEGVDGAFLVQEVAEFAYEYRLFVVGHQVVGGAGCIESMTPLDNESPLDPKVERVRGSGSVARRWALGMAYADFGDEVARELAREVPALRSYVMDVAHVNGRLAVVELNSLLNSGLYASRPQDVVKALDQDLDRIGGEQGDAWS